MEENKRLQDGNLGRMNKDQDDKLNNDRDISSIDQQEGNLKHGEVGGNLNEQMNVREEEKTKPR